MNNSLEWNNPYQDVNEGLRKELLEKEQQISDLNKEVGELSSHIFTTRELREKLDDLESTARKAKEMELKLKTYEFHEFNLDYMKQRVQDLEAESARYLREKCELEETNSTVIPKLQAKVAKLKDRISELSSKDANSLVEKSDKDVYIGQLQGKLDSKIKENRALAEKIQFLESEAGKQDLLVKDLVSEKADTESLPRSNDSTLKEKLTHLEVENARLKVVSAQGGSNAEVEELSDEIEIQQNTIRKQKDEIALITRRLELTTEERDSLSQRIQLLTQEYDVQQKQLEQQLQNTIQRNQQEGQTWARRVKDAEEESDRLLNRVQEAEEQMQEARRRFNAENSTIKGQLNDQNERIEELSSNVASLEFKLRGTQEKLQKANRENDCLTSQIDDLQGELQNLKLSLQAANSERSSDRTQLSQQIMEYKENLRIVEEESRIFKKRLEDMTEEKDKHMRALVEAEDNAKKIKSAYTEEKENLLREIKEVKVEYERTLRQKEADMKILSTEISLQNGKATQAYQQRTNELSTKLEKANAALILSGKEKREIMAQLELAKKEIEESKEKEKGQIDAVIESERTKLQKQFDMKLRATQEKEKELALKLKEVDEQLNQQALVDEYEAKIATMQNEQLLVTQAFYRMSKKLENMERQTEQGDTPLNKENPSSSESLAARIKQRQATATLKKPSDRTALEIVAERRQTRSATRPSLSQVALADRTVTK
eukprot:TRINITY_DN4586_c0_g1_i2.p1 TRINITY_DN4586_c0_g1~~TRINITY_DN4586_c0_g1_i2.p1  ORF type:complete len:718 (-),score=207.55 TRINITY_DN4586_c0_g1_i2:149-2302(-)